MSTGCPAARNAFGQAGMSGAQRPSGAFAVHVQVSRMLSTFRDLRPRVRTVTGGLPAKVASVQLGRDGDL